MTTTDRSDILATAEALLALQLKLPTPLDYHLHRAIHKALVHYFLMIDPQVDAKSLAEVVIHSAYGNGENLAYQIKLIADGEIIVS